MIKKKTIKFCVAVLLLFSMLFGVLTSLYPFYDQEQNPNNFEYLIVSSSDPNAFISVWNTTLTSLGSSESNQVRLPLQIGGNYDFKVDWGDGTNDTIILWNQATVTHTYDSEDIYTINITGTIEGWRFDNWGDDLKILEIKQWGCLRLGNLGSYFYGCRNLILTATDNLDLRGTTNLYRAFGSCPALGNSGNMSGWDVSKVINMESMFYHADSFNQPIGEWNVSRVTDMSGMFSGASSFNQPIGEWNVSRVTDMGGMFTEAFSFNQPLGEWDVSNVTIMSGMFYHATSFNQPIGNWNVSNVKSMENLFLSASSFNQPIGNWSVSKVSTMKSMFDGASSFNAPIGSWNVSRVNTMQEMFCDASSFNQSIGNWDVSNVSNMDSIFEGASSFNQPIGDWNVSIVTNMYQMFYRASSFNQPIGDWNVSRVTNMYQMFFEASSFNQPIGKWDVSSVKDIRSMFLMASSFNQPLGKWNLTSATSLHQMFRDASSFNQSISNWNVSRIESMTFMFSGASSFNQPINNWDVSSVTSMHQMFRYASSFNQPLSNWDVSLVNDMSYMFDEATSFNQPIGNWNVSSVTTMQSMFSDAYSFNQAIGDWNVSSVTDMRWMFMRVTLSALNYDNLLLGWSQLSLQNGVDFVAGYSKYTNKAADARQDIITNYSWTISDGGLGSPGTFTLSSNAGNPDNDGDFSLIWDSSERAGNYSVFSHSSYITEINGSLVLIANKTTNLTLELNGYTDGIFYFIVVAHNEYDDTCSNCITVWVGLTPGDFILSSNAKSPDNDGTFNLTWNASLGGNNYSVYRHSSYITEINGSLISLSSQIINLTFEISGYTDDTYYFIIVAHNIYGDTLSNCIKVVVGSAPGYFMLSSDADNPDNDGNFYLTWDISERASNYSVFSHSNYITEINGSLVLIAEEITNLTLELNGYTDGIYYFIVVAHNIHGFNLSNCITVIIKVIPGNFTLTSNADNPDTDGVFDLIWTTSWEANNYSVYLHISYIADINESIILLADSITDLTFYVSGFSDGSYYFIIVAHNKNGDTLSNCIMITVSIRGGSFTIWGYDFILIFAIFGITIILMVKRSLRLLYKKKSIFIRFW